MNLETTFTYNGAIWAVLRETIRSRLYRNIMYTKFPRFADMSNEEWVIAETFIRVALNTRVEGDPGFVIAKATDSSEAVMASFEAFLNQPAELLERLDAAFGEVNVPITDVDLIPGEELPEKKESAKT